jgi:hypothetical protein
MRSSISDKTMNTQPTPFWPATGWVAEALAGAIAGLALATGVGLAGARLFAGSADGWGDLIGAIVGMIIGYTIGVSIGVSLAGRLLRRPGSFWAALAGGVVGVALVLLLAEPLRLNSSAPLLQSSLAIVAPLLATLAFNAGARLKR